MNGALIIAGLTIKEAIRRRVFIASLLIALIFVLFAFAHIPLGRHMQHLDAEAQRDAASKVFAWLGCGMIKFFATILAIQLAAGAITAEVERGVLSIVVPKPMRRLEIYLGKWIGFLALLAASVALWAALLVFAIYHQTGYFHPRMLLGVLATGLFPLLFVTLTLFFSSFATYALSAGLALIAAGVALAEDFLLRLGRIYDADSLTTTAHLVSCIVPLSRMNHWITRGLGNAGMDLSALDPTSGPAAVATNGADMIYIVSYIIAALVLGIVVFQRRDL